MDKYDVIKGKEINPGDRLCFDDFGKLVVATTPKWNDIIYDPEKMSMDNGYVYLNAVIQPDE